MQDYVLRGGHHMFKRILKCASSLLIAACLGLTGACGGEEGDDEPMIEPGLGENGGKADETGKDVRAYACVSTAA